MNLKFLFIISALLVGCGPDVSESRFGSEINTLRSLVAEDNLSSNEVALIADFCSSLDHKLRFYNSTLTDEESQFTFMEYAEAGCDEEPELSENSYNVRSVGSKLFYTNNFVFPEVVDVNSFEVRSICTGAGIDGEFSRSEVIGTRARWFSLADNNNSECRDGAVDSGTVCLKIETGVKEAAGDSYRIISVEFLRTTRTDSRFRGVIYSRQLRSSESCESGEATEKIQVIKGFGPRPVAPTGN